MSDHATKNYGITPLPATQAGQAGNPPRRHLSFDQAIELATQHQVAGRLQQSQHLLQKVLQKLPQHPEALHVMGIVAHQLGATIRLLAGIGGGAGACCCPQAIR